MLVHQGRRSYVAVRNISSGVFVICKSFDKLAWNVTTFTPARAFTAFLANDVVTVCFLFWLALCGMDFVCVIVVKDDGTNYTISSYIRGMMMMMMKANTHLTLELQIDIL